MLTFSFQRNFRFRFTAEYPDANSVLNLFQNRIESLNPTLSKVENSEYRFVGGIFYHQLNPVRGLHLGRIQVRDFGSTQILDVNLEYRTPALFLFFALFLVMSLITFFGTSDGSLEKIESIATIFAFYLVMVLFHMIAIWIVKYNLLRYIRSILRVRLNVHE